MFVISELYYGLSDLIITAGTLTFTELQKKLAAAEREAKKQSRVTGKLHSKFLLIHLLFTCNYSIKFRPMG